MLFIKEYFIYSFSYRLLDVSLLLAKEVFSDLTTLLLQGEYLNQLLLQTYPFLRAIAYFAESGRVLDKFRVSSLR